MDPASCEDLHGRLSGLVVLLGHRMRSEGANLICHVAGVGEYSLALEELAGLSCAGGEARHRPGAQRHDGAGRETADG
jgi:hypothetical protein